ncbi:hypothetical protein D0962_03185 [Leptolyngbyaceae cyanobacterium CCMR0082]|uniref:Uncharacterized protein n=2 Tax=Adonisia turfae TaxID=2950184 RepID=A0A6M0S008_9CYAN|nr:hypothetical protein [Adonisia turfae CCMR0081]NEZ61787.1 hypothetical protein [Adonisia turfae CCMR0082]
MIAVTHPSNYLINLNFYLNFYLNKPQLIGIFSALTIRHIGDVSYQSLYFTLAILVSRVHIFHHGVVLEINENLTMASQETEKCLKTI